jgi:hypothetical protein
LNRISRTEALRADERKVPSVQIENADRDSQQHRRKARVHEFILLVPDVLETVTGSDHSEGSSSLMPRLAYYGQQWPFPQGAAAGPYPMFAGPLRGQARQGSCIMVGRRLVRLAPQKKLRCACRRRGLRGLGDTTAGLPAGSSLVYSATWAQGVLLEDYTSVVADISSNLSSQGIVIDNSSGKAWYQSGYGLTLSIHTTIDFNSANDVKSIIDHWIQAKASGGMPQSSITSAALAQQIPSSPAGTPVGTNNTACATDLTNYQAAQAAGDTVSAQMWMNQYQADCGGGASSTSVTTWLSNNWPWVAAGLGAALLLREF